MSITDLLKTIQKKHWDGSARLFKDFENVEVKRLSTWLPSLDLAMWGWIPEWRILELYWVQSSWKSTLAILFLAEVQRAYPDKKVWYIDVEFALDPDYAKALWLDMDNVVFCQPNSAEEALSIMEELCGSWEIKAVVLDSVAKLTPMKELSWEIWDAEMGMRARLMSQALRKITPKASANECTCFFINQIRKSFDPYAFWDTRPGGNALPFDASVIIRTKTKKDKNADGSGVTTFDIIKNKVGIPFKTTDIAIKFGKWFDYLQDLITCAIATWTITRAGAFYSFWEKKWQGEEKMRIEITEDKKLQKDIWIALKKLSK